MRPKATVFCRFAGCNLRSGREQDRAKAICRVCDTDFRGTDGEQDGTYASLHDVQIDPDTRGIAIEPVGVSGLRYPLTFRSCNGTATDHRHARSVRRADSHCQRHPQSTGHASD